MDAIPVCNIEEPSLTPPPPVHVASLIAHVKPTAMADVAGWLELQPQVEIHTQSPKGKFAVVMESPHEQAVLDLLDNLNQQQGVLSTALIYHEIIDGEEDA